MNQNYKQTIKDYGLTTYYSSLYQMTQHQKEKTTKQLLKNRWNIQKYEYLFTPKASKRLNYRLFSFIFLAEAPNIINKTQGGHYYMLTLTLPSKQKHEDKHLNKILYEPFKIYFERHNKNYLWLVTKYEKQKNKNIHYHILYYSHKYNHLNIQQEQLRWNKILYKNNYSLKGKFSPNSFDLSYRQFDTKKPEYMASYLTKITLYLSKKEQKNYPKLHCRPYSFNTKLNIEMPKNIFTPQHQSELYKIIGKDNPDKKHDFFETYYLNSFELLKSPLYQRDILQHINQRIKPQVSHSN